MAGGGGSQNQISQVQQSPWPGVLGNALDLFGNYGFQTEGPGGGPQVGSMGQAGLLGDPHNNPGLAGYMMGNYANTLAYNIPSQWRMDSIMQNGGMLQNVAGLNQYQISAEEEALNNYYRQSNENAISKNFLSSEMNAANTSQWAPLFGGAWSGIDPVTLQQVGPGLGQTAMGGGLAALWPLITNSLGGISDTMSGANLNRLAPSMDSSLAGLNATMHGSYLHGLDPYMRESLSGLQDTMSGQYVDANSNPYLQHAISGATQPIYQNLQQNIMPETTSSAEAAGRYGSGAMSGLLMNATQSANQTAGNIGSQMEMQNYTQERTNQQAAQKYASDLYMQERAYQQQAREYVPGLYSQERTNQQQAQEFLPGLFGQEQQLQMQAAQYPVDIYRLQSQLAMQAIPQSLNIQAQTLKNLGAMSGAGQELQQYAQNLLNAQTQNSQMMYYLPYNMLSNLGNLLFTGGGLGGVKTVNEPIISPSFAQSLMGAGMAGMGGYGLAGSIPGLSEYAPYIGAGLGIGSMF